MIKENAKVKFDKEILVGTVELHEHAIPELVWPHDHGVFTRDSDGKSLHIEDLGLYSPDGKLDLYSPAGSHWWDDSDECLKRALVEELKNELFRWGGAGDDWLEYIEVENDFFRIDRHLDHFTVVKKGRDGRGRVLGSFTASEWSEFVDVMMGNSETSSEVSEFKVTERFKEMDSFFAKLSQLKDKDGVYGDILIKDGDTYWLDMRNQSFQEITRYFVLTGMNCGGFSPAWEIEKLEEL